MSSKWNMIVDIARCHNCRNCFLATKDEHVGNDFPGYAAPQPAGAHNWVDIVRKERGRYPIAEANFMPVMCNHCDDAPCMKVAKNDAITKREDGIVIIDPEKSKGQKEIVDACPYDAISWNEEKQIPQAWIFDAHLLDEGWAKTRIEQSCPMNVFKSVKVEDGEMQRLADAENLEVLQPELGTKPRVYYKNLHLYNKCFVGGSVVMDVDGVEENAENAEVLLKQNGNEIGRSTTDVFGEFKLDRLVPNSGSYQLEISLSGAGQVRREFTVGAASVYLGTINLSE